MGSPPRPVSRQNVQDSGLGDSSGEGEGGRGAHFARRGRRRGNNASIPPGFHAGGASARAGKPAGPFVYAHPGHHSGFRGSAGGLSSCPLPHGDPRPESSHEKGPGWEYQDFAIGGPWAAKAWEPELSMGKRGPGGVSLGENGGSGNLPHLRDGPIVPTFTRGGLPSGRTGGAGMDK